MKRRKFIGAITTSIIAVSSTVKAQTIGQVRRIGWLWNQAPLTAAEFKQHTINLRALGWIEGQNLVIEQRYTNGNANLLPSLTEELVRLKVEIIVAEGTVVALAAKNVTNAIPIVVARSGDPVRAGLVTSLARPGGNITGTSTISPDLDYKRFQILHELLPTAQRIAELVVPANPIDRVTRAERERLLSPLGMQPVFVEVAHSSDLENAVTEAARRGAQVLHVSAEPLLGSNFALIMSSAQKYSLPTMVDNTHFVELGGLFAYGPDYDELDRQLAFVIDKILRGAKPADLPIQQPSKFEFAVNIKTAKAFRITIPQSLVLRADKVIQ